MQKEGPPPNRTVPPTTKSPGTPVQLTTAPPGSLSTNMPINMASPLVSASPYAGTMSQRPKPHQETLVQEAYARAPLNALTALTDSALVLVPGTGLSLHAAVQARMLELDPSSVQTAPVGTPTRPLTIVLDLQVEPGASPTGVWENRIALLAHNAVRNADELGVRTAGVRRSGLARLPQGRVRVAVELSVW